MPYYLSIFKKIPLAWLQVTREKTRLAIAVAGIAFADFLMFIQLGFRDALFEASVLPHRIIDTDLVIINPQFETLFSVRSFPRDHLLQANRLDSVISTNSLYIGSAPWRNPETNIERPILVFGTNPVVPVFKLSEINANLSQLKQLDRVLYDYAGREEFGPINTLLKNTDYLKVQLNKKEVQVVGVFPLGASFAADGNVITSDSTFLRLFPDRLAHEIDVGLIKLKPGVDPEIVKQQLTSLLPENVLVVTKEEFAQREKTYWANATAIGFIFNLGAVVGFLVGMVIVYQILYSDVSEHLPEYATLKAMGYKDMYLVNVLMQEALILAICGFIPGLLFSTGLYHLARTATMLPIIMTAERAITVLVLTIGMCTGSGVIAINKLRTADPADIF